MKKTDISLRKNEIAAVMPHFNVGHILFVRPCGGTANASNIVVTRAGQFFLKRRNCRYSSPENLAYDHFVMRELQRHGLPVPKLVRTVTGSRWVEYQGHVYELYHAIERGTTPNVIDDLQITVAGEMLAHFHVATENIAPPGNKAFGRFWDPKNALKLLRPLTKRAQAGNVGTLEGMQATEAAAILQALEREIVEIEEAVSDDVYEALHHTIIHGDWHPANLKFDGSVIVGIFDFDWVDYQPRMVDVADGLLYTCGIRPPVDGPGDIWSLTATPELQMSRMRNFVAAYARACPPDVTEITALPGLMAARWIYSRVDAADRKIKPEDQIRFVLREVMAPLEWLRKNRGELTTYGWWD